MADKKKNDSVEVKSNVVLSNPVNALKNYVALNKTKYPIFVDCSENEDPNGIIGLQPRIPTIVTLSNKRVSILRAKYLNKITFTEK